MTALQQSSRFPFGSIGAGASIATCALWVALLSFCMRLSAADIVIDGRMTFQRMDGFGSSERVFDDPHVSGNRVNPLTGRASVALSPAQEDEILDQLYVNPKLTRVRPAQPDTSAGAPPPGPLPIEAQIDNADPNVINLSKFDFSWKRLDSHMDYISRARQRGVNTYFLSPVFVNLGWARRRPKTPPNMPNGCWLRRFAVRPSALRCLTFPSPMNHLIRATRSAACSFAMSLKSLVQNCARRVCPHCLLYPTT